MSGTAKSCQIYRHCQISHCQIQKCLEIQKCQSNPKDCNLALQFILASSFASKIVRCQTKRKQRERRAGGSGLRKTCLGCRLCCQEGKAKGEAASFLGVEEPSTPKTGKPETTGTTPLHAPEPGGLRIGCRRAIRPRKRADLEAGQVQKRREFFVFSLPGYESISFSLRCHNKNVNFR